MSSFPNLPTLDGTEKRILRTIQNFGTVPGWQVMSEANVNEAELTTAAKDLVSKHLISVTGNLGNPSEIEKCFFTIVPSNADILQFLF